MLNKKELNEYNPLHKYQPKRLSNQNLRKMSLKFFLILHFRCIKKNSIKGVSKDKKKFMISSTLKNAGS